MFLMDNMDKNNIIFIKQLVMRGCAGMDKIGLKWTKLI